MPYLTVHLLPYYCAPNSPFNCLNLSKGETNFEGK